MLRRVAPAALCAILMLAGACSGGNEQRVLSDCDYSDKVQEIIDEFQRNVGRAVADLTSDTAASTEASEAKEAINALDKELGKAIGDLRKLNVEGEIAKVNEELVGGLEDFKNRLPEATRAADAGDLGRIETILDDAGVAFGNRFEGLDQRYPDAAARLATCQ